MRRKWNNTGKMIKEYRQKQNLSQKALSAKIFGESKHGQFFWNIEAGISGLPPKHMCKTSIILMCPLQDLKRMMVKDYEEALDEMIWENIGRAV